MFALRSVARSSRHCVTLRSDGRERLDFTCSGCANPTATTALSGPDDPCIPQGFRVLALDFDLVEHRHQWRKIRHFSLPHLHSLGLLACQVQAVIFGFCATQCITFGLGKAVLWRHCLPRGTEAFCRVTPSSDSTIATLRNTNSQITAEITGRRCDQHFDQLQEPRVITPAPGDVMLLSATRNPHYARAAGSGFCIDSAQISLTPKDTPQLVGRQLAATAHGACVGSGGLTGAGDRTRPSLEDRRNAHCRPAPQGSFRAEVRPKKYGNS